MYMRFKLPRFISINRFRKLFFCLVVIAGNFIPLTFLKAQEADSAELKRWNMELTPLKFSEYQFKPHRLNLVPGLMVLYGFASLHNGELKNWNLEAREEIWEEHPHTFNHLDNYLQYAPVFSVFALNATGLHGKNNLYNRTITLCIASALTGITVNSLKNVIHSERPDGSDKRSFPSGHTATAFMGAEMLRQELKEVSIWIPIAGYCIAITTGYMRMYNNKHWVSDVFAGAAVGVLSTQLAYYVKAKLNQRHSLRKLSF